MRLHLCPGWWAKLRARARWRSLAALLGRAMSGAKFVVRSLSVFCPAYSFPLPALAWRAASLAASRAA